MGKFCRMLVSEESGKIPKPNAFMCHRGLLYLILLSVHLKDRVVPLPVDLIARRVLPHTLGLNGA